MPQTRLSVHVPRGVPEEVPVEEVGAMLALARGAALRLTIGVVILAVQTALLICMATALWRMAPRDPSVILNMEGR